MNNSSKPKLLIFIVAYNAEKTITQVLSRIPRNLIENYYLEVLIIDDASTDRTFEEGLNAKKILELPFTVKVLFNPINQGYGGNQKIGYHYAIEHRFDYVALIHGDGQYAPECLPQLMEAFQGGEIGAVFGSRMLSRGGALRGGMPLYKFVGNKILTHFENWVLGSNLSEFHSGYRIYSIEALKRIPFDLNTNDFHFDTEIIIQFFLAGLVIKELPIPTYYGDEICRVNGMKYALDVVRSVLKMRAQQLCIFYDRKFDVHNFELNNYTYRLKSAGVNPHTISLSRIKNDSKILDVGCAAGYVGGFIKASKRAYVVGVDKEVFESQSQLDNFIRHDLFGGPPNISYGQFDHILMLDVIEHLPSPESFIEELYEKISSHKSITLMVSTGNVAFIVTRLMLLFGQFNYGKKGILDLTHTRLFTFASLRRLFEQSNYEVLSEEGVPAPFRMVLDGPVGVFLEWLNLCLIKIAPKIFSYQMFFIIKPKPSLKILLMDAQLASAKRKEDI